MGFYPKKKKTSGYRKMKFSPKEISYAEDIAKEVSGYLDIDYEICLAVQKEAFNFIVDQTKERDIYSISLPCVGVFYLSKRVAAKTKLILNRKSKQDESGKIEKQIDFWTHRIGMMNMHRDESGLRLLNLPHHYTPAQISLGRNLPEEYVINKVRVERNKYVDIFAAIEEIQNKHYYKTKESK
jgi:hypothetical protein